VRQNVRLPNYDSMNNRDDLLQFVARIILVVALLTYLAALFAPAGGSIVHGESSPSIPGWMAFRDSVIGIVLFPIFTIQGVLISITNIFSFYMEPFRTQTPRPWNEKPLVPFSK